MKWQPCTVAVLCCTVWVCVHVGFVMCVCVYVWLSWQLFGCFGNMWTGLIWLRMKVNGELFLKTATNVWVSLNSLKFLTNWTTLPLGGVCVFVWFSPGQPAVRPYKPASTLVPIRCEVFRIATQIVWRQERHASCRTALTSVVSNKTSLPPQGWTIYT